MTAFYAAAKYRVHEPVETQWHDLSDLTMVAVELVRLARATGRHFGSVERAIDFCMTAAKDEWEGYDDAP